MAARFFLLSLFLWQPLLALSIPRYDAQNPLSPALHHSSRTDRASVILAFSSSGSDEVRHFEVPVQKQISSGAGLPVRPDWIRIETMKNQHGQSVSLEELDQVMCRIVLKLSEEERAALNSIGLEKVLPWFQLKDEAVLFQESSSRWFLAGRAIAGYECR